MQQGRETSIDTESVQIHDPRLASFSLLSFFFFGVGAIRDAPFFFFCKTGALAFFFFSLKMKKTGLCLVRRPCKTAPPYDIGDPFFSFSPLPAVSFFSHLHMCVWIVPSRPSRRTVTTVARTALCPRRCAATQRSLIGPRFIIAHYRRVRTEIGSANRGSRYPWQPVPCHGLLSGKKKKASPVCSGPGERMGKREKSAQRVPHAPRLLREWSSSPSFFVSYAPFQPPLHGEKGGAKWRKWNLWATGD